MSDLTRRAQSHLRTAEESDRADITLNLRWTVAYALVAIARGVDELVQLAQELRLANLTERGLNEEGTEFHS